MQKKAENVWTVIKLMKLLINNLFLPLNIQLEHIWVVVIIIIMIAWLSIYWNLVYVCNCIQYRTGCQHWWDSFTFFKKCCGFHIGLREIERRSIALCPHPTMEGSSDRKWRLLWLTALWSMSGVKNQNHGISDCWSLIGHQSPIWAPSHLMS